MRHFRRHANALAQRRVRMNGFTDVDRVGTHLDSQRDFTNHVTGMGTDNAAAQKIWPWPCASSLSSNSSLVHPSSRPFHFGVGVGHARDHTDVEGRGKFLLALPFTGDQIKGSTRSPRTQLPTGNGSMQRPHRPAQLGRR